MSRVLDPCCGSRMMWFDRGHPDVVFGDLRSEVVTVTDRSHRREGGTRTLRIEPDAIMDFRALPYPDGSFHLVAFDPPHLVRAGPRSWLAAKYGKLGADWRDDLRAGFAECFRVLDPNGTLVFKWNETQVKVADVLACTPVQPLFGHRSGRGGLTHWLVFMKDAPPAHPAAVKVQRHAPAEQPEREAAVVKDSLTADELTDVAREPLSDEQIDCIKQGPSQDYRAFARAIERAHGIPARVDSEGA